MITITKRLEFDAGHRLLKHEGKCRHVHGHRYAVEVTCKPVVGLDDVGRVIDFGQVKEKLGGWIDDKLDHGFIAQEGDPILDWLREQGMKHYVLLSPPTAETLAEVLFNKADELLTGIKVVRVVVYETPTSRAECNLL